MDDQKRQIIDEEVEFMEKTRPAIIGLMLILTMVYLMLRFYLRSFF